MPWTLLGRLIGTLVVSRLLRRRRGAPVRSPNTAAGLRRRANRAVEDARTLGHVVLAALSAAMGIAGLTITITLTLLGPRWLGGVAAVLTVGAAACATVETRRTRRSLEWRRRRAHLNAVRDDLGDEERDGPR
jgi:hypothetical protein